MTNPSVHNKAASFFMSLFATDKVPEQDSKIKIAPCPTLGPGKVVYLVECRNAAVMEQAIKVLGMALHQEDAARALSMTADQYRENIVPSTGYFAYRPDASFCGCDDCPLNNLKDLVGRPAKDLGARGKEKEEEEEEDVKAKAEENATTGQMGVSQVFGFLELEKTLEMMKLRALDLKAKQDPGEPATLEIIEWASKALALLQESSKAAKDWQDHQ